MALFSIASPSWRLLNHAMWNNDVSALLCAQSGGYDRIGKGASRVFCAKCRDDKRLKAEGL